MARLHLIILEVSVEIVQEHALEQWLLEVVVAQYVIVKNLQGTFVLIVSQVENTDLSI
jgi:hypothetical protein